jgi:two-component system, NtrC family, nitrogen regulation response regulator GlnG
MDLVVIYSKEVGMGSIWIVDDDQSIRFVLEKALAREGLPSRSFSNARDAMSELSLASRGEADLPQVLISDIRMPGPSGLELLSKARVISPGLPIIIMTAYSDLDSAVSAFQGGAFEYLAKPFDVAEAVALIRRALEESQREAVALDLGQNTADMLGQAPAMQDLFRAIGRLSQSSVTVLITGESGTGKELVARALHRHSPRGGGQGMAAGPFIAINTAAIPRDLLESELFGHERGAFTGAATSRRGRFEQADGGTLFLDEIGDMPLELQTRLLRVLSDGQFYRVGGHSVVKTNVRVIAATHQDLEQRVKEGAFREDLFHRLNVIRLRIPPLRERHEDIPVLTRHFLQVSARQLGVDPKRISDAAVEILSHFEFSGNVRQLENLCHWLTVMAPGQVIEAKDLPPEVVASASQAGNPPATALGRMAPGQRVEMSSAMPAVSVSGNTGMVGIPAPSTNAVPVTAMIAPPAAAGNRSDIWQTALYADAKHHLEAGDSEVWDLLQRGFESALIRAALDQTRGRRVEAAVALGIGRNTITRKISDLGLDDTPSGLGSLRVA